MHIITSLGPLAVVSLLAMVFMMSSSSLSQATPVMYSAGEMREIERLRAGGVGEVSSISPLLSFFLPFFFPLPSFLFCFLCVEREKERFLFRRWRLQRGGFLLCIRIGLKDYLTDRPHHKKTDPNPNSIPPPFLISQTSCASGMGSGYGYGYG